MISKVINFIKSHLNTDIIYHEKVGDRVYSIIKCSGLNTIKYKVVISDNNAVVMDSQKEGRELINNIEESYKKDNNLYNSFVVLNEDGGSKLTDFEPTIKYHNEQIQRNPNRKRIGIIFTNNSTIYNGKVENLEDSESDRSIMKSFLTKYGFIPCVINSCNKNQFFKELSNVVQSIQQIEQDHIEVVVYIKSFSIEINETQILFNDGEMIPLSTIAKIIKLSYRNKKSSTIIIPHLCKIDEGRFGYNVKSECIPEDSCYIVPDEGIGNYQVQFVKTFTDIIDSNLNLPLDQVAQSIQNIIITNGSKQFSCGISSSLKCFSFE